MSIKNYLKRISIKYFKELKELKSVETKNAENFSISSKKN
jgi:hypothetical protein